jgi:hypothetical protein
MSKGAALAIAIVATVLTGGCTIKRHVDPVPTTSISSLCIAKNDAVWSKQFLPTLRDRLARHGITTTVYDGPTTPDDCSRHLEYEARWSWDIALYLMYAQIRIYDGATLVGSATYDARDGDARLDKFGSGEERLAGLVDDLLRNVNRPAPTAARDATTSSARVR